MIELGLSSNDGLQDSEGRKENKEDSSHGSSFGSYLHGNYRDKCCFQIS